MPDYDYDVAFSFLAKDESVATQLADLFEGRLRVFLYSRRQEQLAGTDGEKTFNEVFSKQARLVVVLYREEWGQSPWTRVEETAIRNRAFEDGYDFVVFIPLDEKPTVPKWLPRNRIWVGLSRWGISGAASVIDARFQELGGEPKVETLDTRAAKLERDRIFEFQRKQYLGSEKGVRNALESYNLMKDSVLKTIPRLQTIAPSLHISAKHQDQNIVLLADGPALSINWQNRFSNTLDESHLVAATWDDHPPFPGIIHFGNPSPTSQLRMSPDLDRSNSPAWLIKGPSGSRLLNSLEAAEHILEWWLEKASKPKFNS